MFGTVLLMLASSFGTFSVFRMYQRTGHNGVFVLVAGVAFVISVFCSIVAGGGLFWSVYFQTIAGARVAIVSLLILMVSCLVSTGMALLLSVKEWPIKNLED